jgi:hypothetical protein
MNPAILETDIINLRNITNDMSLDSKIDRVHSIWIRLQATDENGNAKCKCCPAELNFGSLVCGHFIKRRHTQFRWSPLNTDAICPECNGIEESDSLAEPMRDYKVSTLGKEVVEEMEKLIHQPYKISKYDKETLLKTRRLQCRKLLEDKNFTVQIP